MANQKKESYVKVPGEVLERLSKFNLSAYEWRFLMILWRKTWGWQKEEDSLSVSQIAQITGIHKSHVSRAKRMLIERRIVTNGGNTVTNGGNFIKFNKNYDLWRELPMGVTSHRVTNGGRGVTPIGIKSLPPSADTKDTTKETLQKKAPPLPPPKGGLSKPQKVSFDTESCKLVNLPPDKINLFQEKFPALDVPQEIRKMEAWLMANPKNRKSNYERFITNWLSRAQDKAPARGNMSPQISKRQFDLPEREDPYTLFINEDDIP